MARFGCTITVATGKMTGSRSNFPWLFTEANLPTAAIDGGVQSILNGGGNLRCYVDATKATQLPIHVVRYVTGGTPRAEVRGKSGNLGVGGTVYIEADTVATTQPAVTDTYGQYAVWSDFEYAFLFDDLGRLVDATGNYALTETGTIVRIDGAIGDGIDCAGIGYHTVSGYAGPSGAQARTHVVWFKTNTTTIDEGLGDYGTNNNGQRYTYYLDNGRPRTEIQGSFALTNTTFADDVWHQFTSKVDGTATWPACYTCLVDGDVQALSTGGSITLNTVPSPDIQFRRYIPGVVAPQKMDEQTLRLFHTDNGQDKDEFTNQSDPATFWTTSAWEDQDAGGTPSGTLAVTTDAATMASAGQFGGDADGSLSITLADVAYSAAGVQGDNAAGTVSTTLADCGYVAAGAHLPPISGDASYTTLSYYSAVGRLDIDDGDTFFAAVEPAVRDVVREVLER